MTYADKLRDPRWQKKRLKILEYAEWRCQICGAKNRTLHVHHSYYLRGKEPWQYPDGSLIAACEQCHEKIHPEKRKAPAPPTTPALSNDKHTQVYPEPVSIDPELEYGIMHQIRNGRPLIATWLEQGRITSFENGILTYSFPEHQKLAGDYIGLKNNAEFVSSVVRNITGKTCSVVTKVFHPTVKERFGSIFAALDGVDK